MRLSARLRAPSSVVGLTLVLAGVGCAACGTGQVVAPGSSATPTCTPMPSEPAVLEGKVAVFDLTGVADLITVVNHDGYFVIDARAEGEITDLTIAFQQVVSDAGFNVAGSDDEGFEAEVFFARGNVAAGQIVLTESPCPGLVDVEISVLDHPAVFPDESGTPPG